MEVLELDWIKQWAMFSPQAIALQDGDSGRTYTYAGLYRATCAMSRQLAHKYNITHGDRIVVLSTNELEYVVLMFAAQRLGAAIVPVNFRLTAREVEHIVGDAEPKALFYGKEFAEVIEALSPSVRPPQMNLLIGTGSLADEIEYTDRNPTPFLATAEDAAMIIYTSGTTGAPKGAVLSHRMLFWNSINTALRLNITQHDSAVIFLPFFHTGGMNVLTTPFLHHGARVIILKKFDAEQILTLSQEENCTLLFGVPTTMDMMARSEAFKKCQFPKLRYAIVGGEPMPVDLIETWHAKGVSIRQGFGLTEFGPNCFSLNEQDAIRKIGSIGFPNFYNKAAVVDDDGKELGPNEIGELILNGPMCMTGYWKNDKATRETIRDGWLYTGDLVRKDEEGFFYVVGRKKDMFKSGGENVYPAELEQVLRRCEGVREVAVIGVPDEKWGEVGKAFIARDSEALTEEVLMDYCLKNFAKFKVPKSFVFLPELPKGDSGKILKKALK